MNFLYLFMSLLVASIVENSDFLAGIKFLFLRKRLGSNTKVIQYKIVTWLTNCYRVRQNWAIFCDIVALILGWNCVKDIKVIKFVKKIKLKGPGTSKKQKTVSGDNHRKNNWERTLRKNNWEQFLCGIGHYDLISISILK